MGNITCVIRLFGAQKSEFKKKSDIYHWGRGVPWGPGGSSSPPLWSLANIKCVAAVILCGAAVILRGPTVILCSMTSICSNLHDILHFQHQFFEIFLSVLGFSKGKIHFFQKCSKNGLVAKKCLELFR